MSLDIPVFDTKNVKRFFYYFFAFNVLFTAAIVIPTVVFHVALVQAFLTRVDSWVVFLVLFAGAGFYSRKSKKELHAIVETTDLIQKFSRYESYYRQKLVWNAFSLVTSGLILLLTSKQYFLYLLLLQLVLSFLFYPGKKLLSKELQNEEIVFT